MKLKIETDWAYGRPSRDVWFFVTPQLYISYVNADEWGEWLTFRIEVFFWSINFGLSWKIKR